MTGDFSNGPGRQMKGDFFNGPGRADKKEMSLGQNGPGPEKSARADLYCIIESFSLYELLASYCIVAVFLHTYSSLNIFKLYASYFPAHFFFLFFKFL